MKKLFLILLLGIFAYGENYLKQGDAQYANGNFGKAIELYTKAISVNPNGCSAYNNRGLIYYERKDYKSAIRDYSSAIAKQPNCLGAIINRGVSYSRSGDYKNASIDARKACALGDCELLEMLKDNGILQD
ncbi:MAG: tetratricopeptide repeat protein [Campylobacterales bacterium]|nr:tetratricopeptide repeat protein [Campylobacterales bacterium]